MGTGAEAKAAVRNVPISIGGVMVSPVSYGNVWGFDESALSMF